MDELVFGVTSLVAAIQGNQIDKAGIDKKAGIANSILAIFCIPRTWVNSVTHTPGVYYFS